MIDVQKLIEAANLLSALPESSVRLAKMLSNPECDLLEVVDVIKHDIALTAKLLGAANSAASGSTMRVVSVQDAVVRLGVAQIITLSVASGARPFLQSRIPAYNLTEGQLWRHSVAAAVAAEVMPSFCRATVPAETFTAALLHDIGKLLMSRFLSAEVLYYIQSAQDLDHLPPLDAESQILTVNHAELGGLIAQHWNLPDGIVQGITHHHHPEMGTEPICDFVCLANLVAKYVEAKVEKKEFKLTIPPDLMERVGLTHEILDSYLLTVGARFEALTSRYNAV